MTTAKWEYEVLTVDNDRDLGLEWFLNNLGRDGWECFQVVTRPVNNVVGTSTAMISWTLYLKRRSDE